MENSAKHVPKGSMCLSCKRKMSDCSKLDFSKMMPIKRYDVNTVGVKCGEFKKEL